MLLWVSWPRCERLTSLTAAVPLYANPQTDWATAIVICFITTMSITTTATTRQHGLWARMLTMPGVLYRPTL